MNIKKANVVAGWQIKMNWKKKKLLYGLNQQSLFCGSIITLWLVSQHTMLEQRWYDLILTFWCSNNVHTTSIQRRSNVMSWLCRYARKLVVFLFNINIILYLFYFWWISTNAVYVIYETKTNLIFFSKFKHNSVTDMIITPVSHIHSLMLHQHFMCKFSLAVLFTDLFLFWRISA